MAEPLVLGCHLGFLIGTLSIRQSLKRSDAHKCLRSDLGDKHFVRLMISKGMTSVCGCLEFISARSAYHYGCKSYEAWTYTRELQW